MRLRKTLTRKGVDSGAETIAADLAATAAIDPVPAVWTIWRILSRSGSVPQPQTAALVLHDEPDIRCGIWLWESPAAARAPAAGELLHLASPAAPARTEPAIHDYFCRAKLLPPRQASRD